MQSTRIVRLPAVTLSLICYMICSLVLSQASVTCAQSASSRPKTAANTSASDAPAEPKKPVLFDTTAIDKTADPCTDFYQYACGNWVKANPVPPDQIRWGRFNELAERNNWLLYQQLQAAANPRAKRSPLEAKYGDFYAACMNTAEANEKGMQPVQPALDQIAALKDKRSLASLLASLNTQYGTNALFRFRVEQDDKDSSRQIAAAMQDGLGLPDRDYYLETSERQQKIRQQYTQHVTNIFKLAGDTPEQAADEAASVLAIETALAKASLSHTELREPEKNYHLITVAELDKLAPDFDWSEYFDNIGVGKFGTLNVAQPEFVKGMNALIDTQSLNAWKSYLRWHTLHTAAPWLSTAFDEENYSFYQATLSGQRAPTPRWKRCTRLTDGLLGEAVGQDWVRRNFPPDAKANMSKLVAALDTALAQDIQQLPWMSEATKRQAEEKLAAIRNKIGYPEAWRDYSSVPVQRDDLLGNIHRASHFERQRNLNKLGKPVDESEWGMTPPTVNAYYSASLNDINFPAGILQPPFFDNSMGPAVNFGGIGVVIGHEMTHGFDDAGSKYDGKGNLREWQTPEDRKAFTERTDCEVAEYNNFEAVPGQKLNGKLTLGENTADNGGIRIAYMALMNTLAAEGSKANEQLEGYTPQQQFFIAFGQVWCSNSTDQAARLLARTDPHAPGKWRVNGSVQNFEGFAKAFGCKKGQPMYPEKSCRVW
ncbi:MAG TPA: M13 family metallopeptidase [Acidisarcina sp.]|nr:M13 family metallopeptidase [Acidisarcina sp.]